MTLPPPEQNPQRVQKHSLEIAGHRTSVSLENIFWMELCAIAAARGLSPPALVAEIDARRGAANLSSALRVFVLESVRARAKNAALHVVGSAPSPAGSDQ